MKPSMREIARATAQYFKIDQADLYAEARHQKVAWPRQIAMTLCRDMSRRSLPDIGHHFGGRDHTTVIHACKAVFDHAAADDETTQALMTIAAMASGMSIDRNRREQEWALSLHAGQPMVALEPVSEPVAPPQPRKPRPAVSVYPDRRIVVVNGRGGYAHRPALMATDLRQPTKAQLTAGRA